MKAIISGARATGRFRDVAGNARKSAFGYQIAFIGRKLRPVFGALLRFSEAALDSQASKTPRPWWDWRKGSDSNRTDAPADTAGAPLSNRAAVAVALLRAPLRGFFVGRFLRLGEEVDLLGDDLAAVPIGAAVIGPLAIVDAAGDHDHRALGDVLGNALADPVEAGDAVPLDLALTVALAVLEAAAGRQRDGGDGGVAPSFADLGGVADEANEGDGILHGSDLSKLISAPKGTSL